MSTVQRHCAHRQEAEILEFLSCASSYPETTARVEMVETHISWVFLTKRFAYKLKKPVRFEFLDFSSSALRRAACEAEVRLNRRLAPRVYLKVVPLTFDGRTWHLDGHGGPMDWLVKMRRLRADRSVDALIRADRLTLDDIDQVAAKLVDFYRQQPPLPVETDRYLHSIERHVQHNDEELRQSSHELDVLAVRRAAERQWRMLRLRPDWLRNRVRDGRIIDGHGDLRPEHIYVDESINIIDCVEFNSDFRCLDVLDELCFLAMECAYLDAKHVGGRILDYYCQSTDDLPATQLLSFYMCYRACVRAKVLSLRAAQLRGRQRQVIKRQANRYLSLADHYASEMGPPFVLIVRGLSGTGKSTVAAALGESLAMELRSTDTIRRRLFGGSPVPAEFGEAIYQYDHRQTVYDEMFQQAEQILSDRLSVVLDGTFLSSRLRGQAASLARRHNAIPLTIHCRCPDEVARERITARLSQGNSASEAQPDFHAQQQQLEEPDSPHMLSCEIDTTESIPIMLQRIYRQLANAES